MRINGLKEPSTASTAREQRYGLMPTAGVPSGEYALADDELEAFARAREKTPEGVLFLIRVGHRAAHRIGASPGYRIR